MMSPVRNEKKRDNGCEHSQRKGWQRQCPKDGHPIAGTGRPLTAWLDGSWNDFKIEQVVKCCDKPSAYGEGQSVERRDKLGSIDTNAQNSDKREHEASLVPAEIAWCLAHDFANE
jgi:hypothetical protein